MQESLSSEHGRKLFGYAFEQLLDGGRISDERGAHLETARRNIANCRFYVVWDPVHEVTGVFVLHVHHLLVDLFHGHAAPAGFTRKTS